MYLTVLLSYHRSGESSTKKRLPHNSRSLMRQPFAEAIIQRK